MKKLKLRWMVKEPNKPVEEREFDISYKDADDRSSQELTLTQGIVGGYVEVVHIGGQVKGIINEEGLFKNLEPNCGYVGNIIFVREVVAKDEAYFGSLTDEDVRKIKAWTVTHANDVHPGHSGVQVLTGEAADEFRRRLWDYQKLREQEWDSF